MSEARPWEDLSALLAASSTRELKDFLETLAPLETVRSISRLTEEERGRLLELVDPEEAAELLDHIPEAHAVDALEHVSPETAARILEELPSDEQADLIGELDEADAEAILAALSPDEAEEVRELASHPEGTAGSLMITEFLQYGQGLRVGEVVADLQENAEAYADYDVQYAYVHDEAEHLVGVLPLRELLLVPRGRPVERVMIREPLSIPVDASIEELEAFFSEHELFGVPVLDGQGKMIGVVRRAALEEELSERGEEAYRLSQGIVGGEELRGMPVLLRSRRRLAWLSVNIGLNVLAASVIAMHQETLEAVIALAVFLPIVSDMSGCSGSQAVAVSIRELTLGVVRPGDLVRVLHKELVVGVLNGLALGVLLGAVAWAWKGNPWLGVVVGGALALNTTLSVCVGGCVPLVLKATGKDPALASGPILTTITDTSGFLLVLTLASLLLPHLIA